jgi:diaminopimelate epimerase
MKLHFTKMHGAGNDFVVLNATQAPLALTPAQLRHLGDRRFGVGADQILVVEKTNTPGMDFRYRIFNGGSGEEVEQCGNGARCFVRYVADHGLSPKTTLRVETMNTQLELRLQADGRVTVDMGEPIFDLPRVPFNAEGLSPHAAHRMDLWPLDVAGSTVYVAAVSMGNPHAVQVVSHADTAPVATQGPLIEAHPRFPRKVNAGFMQVLSRSHIKLRVFERGAGETLACGTGACAAVVAGIQQGLLDERVEVDTPGGQLTIAWAGLGHPVWMTGPAVTVFEGEIEL